MPGIVADLKRGLRPLFAFAKNSIVWGRINVAGLPLKIESDLKKYLGKDRGDAGKLLRLIVLYLIAAGFADSVLNSMAAAYAQSISPTLLPAFATPPSYKQELITYLVIVFFIVGAVILFWLWNYFPKRQLIPPSLHPFLLFFAAFAGFMGAGTTLAEIFFVLALFITLLFWRGLAEKKKTVPVRRRFDWLRATPLLLALGCLGCVGLAASTWYPVKIPSDYYEFADQIYLSQPALDSLFGRSDKQLTQSQAVECVAKYNTEKQINDIRNGLKTAPDDQSEQLLQFLTEKVLTKYDCQLPTRPAPPATSSMSAAQFIWSPLLQKVAHWEVQAGRLLYHHAYLFVPARHFLTYGFSFSAPYLYGYGNTLTHSALIAWAPSLTTHFYTFPVAVFLGLVAIALVTFYATRNALAAFVGFALGLCFLSLMDPMTLRLAVGFSPLRYLGLAVQVGSIFYLFRGDASKRAYVMPLALAFSFFWNKEFAIIGGAGQLLALLSPSLALSFLQRFAHTAAFIGVMLLIVLLSFGLGRSSDLLDSIRLTFFNIAVPPIPPSALVLFYLATAAMAAILVLASSQFDRRERSARLCALPVLALVIIKYLFYPVVIHLYYSLVFIAPMLLTYYRWTDRSWKLDAAARPRRMIEAQFAVLLVFICYTQVDAFREQAIQIKKAYIHPFVVNRWSTLGESFTTPIPERPIAQRVEAVKSVLKPGDQVLLLSPFDHLIAFYANPERYCGHFELLTNVVTSSDMEDVLRCARASKNLLVIYDKALEIGCPEGEIAAFFHRPSCISKYELKKTLHRIMRTLQPDLTLVREIGDLQFYRRKPPAKGSL